MIQAFKHKNTPRVSPVCCFFSEITTGSYSANSSHRALIMPYATESCVTVRFRREINLARSFDFVKICSQNLDQRNEMFKNLLLRFKILVKNIQNCTKCQFGKRNFCKLANRDKKLTKNVNKIITNLGNQPRSLTVTQLSVAYGLIT